MDLATRITQKSVDEDHLTAKYMLPSTKMANTILRENLNQTRMLQTHKHLLDKQARKELLLVDRTKKNFLSSQIRKRGKWKREDEVRVNCLNLPTIKTEVLNRPTSMKVLYSSPNYHAIEPNQEIFVPLRKTMGVKSKRMEIVSHHTQLAVTHLPPIVQLSDTVLSKYNRYRGISFMTPSLLSKDTRFTNCESFLSTLGIKTRAEQTSSLSNIRSATRGFYLSCPSKPSHRPVSTNSMLQSISSTRGTHR